MEDALRPSGTLSGTLLLIDVTPCRILIGDPAHRPARRSCAVRRRTPCGTHDASGALHRAPKHAAGATRVEPGRRTGCRARRPGRTAANLPERGRGDRRERRRASALLAEQRDRQRRDERKSDGAPPRTGMEATAAATAIATAWTDLDQVVERKDLEAGSPESRQRREARRREWTRGVRRARHARDERTPGRRL